MNALNAMDATAAARAVADRQAEVWDCLAAVTDPELDESVVELNFVTCAGLSCQDNTPSTG